MEQFNNLIEFRQAAYEHGFTKASDAQFELVDALLLGRPIRSFPELSLLPTFRRKWHSSYAAIERGGQDQQWFEWHFIRQIPTQGPKLLSLDGTAWPRPAARVLADRQYVFADADWFHRTGITPAISAGTAGVCLEAVQVAKEMGLTVSCDLNYRKKLWKWGKAPGEVMPELVGYCDVAIGNEEDADKVFGIRAPETDVVAGKVEADKYRYVCEELAKRFPNLKTIAITLRGSISASHNTWSGVLLEQGEFHVAPIYDITHIVDRVGGAIHLRVA